MGFSPGFSKPALKRKFKVQLFFRNAEAEGSDQIRLPYRFSRRLSKLSPKQLRDAVLPFVPLNPTDQIGYTYASDLDHQLGLRDARMRTTTQPAHQHPNTEATDETRA
jgi:hypothetical protein